MSRDPGDAGRRAVLGRVLEIMASSPEEEARVRAAARAVVARQRRERLASPAFNDGWDATLSLPLADLRARLLADGPDGVEARHANPFVGIVGARERSEILARARPGGA
ncbi:MAG: hypothetical protein DI629_20230 [Mesorhizobium amorphae]|nr:MAG: hypothetical protein DI629_20230 [Mesorhizobium amorphae]